MSKAVVYILDKIVWMLLIAAVTTQALQIAGIVDTPKGLGDISYSQDKDYSFQVQVGDLPADVRGKRQTTSDQRSQFIDNLFNIPIAALRAVNNLVQSTRPAFQRMRDFAARRLEKANKAAAADSTQQNQTKPPQRVYPVFVRPKTEKPTSN